MGFGDREEALEAEIAESERPLYGEGGWYAVYFMSRYEHEHATEFEYTDDPNDWIGVAVAIRDDDSDWYQEDIGDEDDDDDPSAWLVFDMDAFDQLGPWWFGWYTCLITGIEEISRQEALEQTWEVIEYEYVYSLFPGWRL